jgi:hypothetical protein
MLSAVQIIQHQMIRVNNKLEKRWREAILAQFEVLSEHLSGGLQKPRRNSAKITTPCTNICIWLRLVTLLQLICDQMSTLPPPFSILHSQQSQIIIMVGCS